MISIDFTSFIWYNAYVELYLGCSPKHLRKHIEDQFLPKMTWDNYGIEWHVDHIIPLSRFDLTDEKILGKLAHYSNLRPLWAAENIRKGNKLPTELVGGY